MAPIVDIEEYIEGKENFFDTCHSCRLLCLVIVYRGKEGLAFDCKTSGIVPGRYNSHDKLVVNRNRIS